VILKVDVSDEEDVVVKLGKVTTSKPQVSAKGVKVENHWFEKILKEV
jgi:hypothetical protein